MYHNSSFVKALVSPRASPRVSKRHSLLTVRLSSTVSESSLASPQSQRLRELESVTPSPLAASKNVVPGSTPSSETLENLARETPGTSLYNSFQYDPSGDHPYPLWWLDPEGPLYSYMIKVAQNSASIIQTLHDSLQMPWWATIVASGALLRLALLPLNVYSLRNVANSADARQDISLIREAFTRAFRMQKAAAEVSGTPVSASAQVNLLMNLQRGIRSSLHKANCYPWRSLIIPFVQVPFVIAGVLGARHSVLLGNESFEQEGALWFQDLTVSDPYYALPIMSLGLAYASLEVIFGRSRKGVGSIRENANITDSAVPHVSQGEDKKAIQPVGAASLLGNASHLFKNTMQTALIFSLPFMCELPTGLYLLMSANSLWTIFYLKTVRTPSVYRAITGRDPPGLAAVGAPGSSKSGSSGDNSPPDGSPTSPQSDSTPVTSPSPATQMALNAPNSLVTYGASGLFSHPSAPGAASINTISASAERMSPSAAAGSQLATRAAQNRGSRAVLYEKGAALVPPTAAKQASTRAPPRLSLSIPSYESVEQSGHEETVQLSPITTEATKAASSRVVYSALDTKSTKNVVGSANIPSNGLFSGLLSFVSDKIKSIGSVAPYFQRKSTPAMHSREFVEQVDTSIVSASGRSLDRGAGMGSMHMASIPHREVHVQTQAVADSSVTSPTNTERSVQGGVPMEETSSSSPPLTPMDVVDLHLTKRFIYYADDHADVKREPEFLRYFSRSLDSAMPYLHGSANPIMLNVAAGSTTSIWYDLPSEEKAKEEKRKAVQPKKEEQKASEANTKAKDRYIDVAAIAGADMPEVDIAKLERLGNSVDVTGSTIKNRASVLWNHSQQMPNTSAENRLYYVSPSIFANASSEPIYNFNSSQESTQVDSGYLSEGAFRASRMNTPFYRESARRLVRNSQILADVTRVPRLVSPEASGHTFDVSNPAVTAPQTSLGLQTLGEAPVQAESTESSQRGRARRSQQRKLRQQKRDEDREVQMEASSPSPVTEAVDTLHLDEAKQLDNSIRESIASIAFTSNIMDTTENILNGSPDQISEATFGNISPYIESHLPKKSKTRKIFTSIMDSASKNDVAASEVKEVDGEKAKLRLASYLFAGHQMRHYFDSYRTASSMPYVEVFSTSNSDNEYQSMVKQREDDIYQAEEDGLLDPSEKSPSSPFDSQNNVFALGGNGKGYSRSEFKVLPRMDLTKAAPEDLKTLHSYYERASTMQGKKLPFLAPNTSSETYNTMLDVISPKNHIKSRQEGHLSWLPTVFNEPHYPSFLLKSQEQDNTKIFASDILGPEELVSDNLDTVSPTEDKK